MFDADGRRIARNGSEVTYLHETPFTSASFESTAASGSYQKEYEPFGGEIGTEPPPNTTPDWIIVGNYNQSGNPLDAQGGCLEDGFPVDCSEMIKRASIGNARAMNRESRVYGLGYILAGFAFSRTSRKVGYQGYKRFDGKMLPNYFVPGSEPQITRRWLSQAGLVDRFEPVYESAWTLVSLHSETQKHVQTEGQNSGRANDCLAFAEKAKELAALFNLHNLTDDTFSSVKASQVQKFMDALVAWGTEFTAATRTAVLGFLAGTVERNNYSGHLDSGFKVAFQDHGPGGSPDQVRHAIGGLLAGYLGGNNVVNKFFMNNWRERNSAKGSRMADRALNYFTMRVGAAIADPKNGYIRAFSLGNWIRDNLCEAGPRGAERQGT